jgi:hypothetical protein
LTLRFVVMDFYCRHVWVKEPTDECYMLNLASRLWFLEPTFPGWAHEH